MYIAFIAYFTVSWILLIQYISTLSNCTINDLGVHSHCTIPLCDLNYIWCSGILSVFFLLKIQVPVRDQYMEHKTSFLAKLSVTETNKIDVLQQHYHWVGYSNLKLFHDNWFLAMSKTFFKKKVRNHFIILNSRRFKAPSSVQKQDCFEFSWWLLF